MIRDPADHHHLWLFEDHRWAVAGAALMYLVAAGLIVVIAVDPGIVQPLDDWWYARMVSVETDWLTVLAKVMDVVGSVWVTVPLRIGVAVLLAVRRFHVLLGYWIATIVVSEVAIGTLKAAYDRPRPPLPLVETTGASFPSGHSVAVAATAVALVIVILAPGVERRIWEVRATVLALVMGLSRPYLRAHWLTDVLAGLLLGAATALLLAAAADAVRARRSTRPGAIPPDGMGRP